MLRFPRLLLCSAIAALIGTAAILAQRGGLPPDQVAQRLAAERELQEIAVVTIGD